MVLNDKTILMMGGVESAQDCSSGRGYKIPWDFSIRQISIDSTNIDAIRNESSSQESVNTFMGSHTRVDTSTMM